MSEPLSSSVLAVTLKFYLLPAFAILTGSVAHALQEIKRTGWRGWLTFFSDIFVAMVAGNILFQFFLIWNTEYAMLSAAIGGYLGPKSVSFLVRAFQANFSKV